MKTWTELYTAFARLAALVPNVDANVGCEELCGRLQDALISPQIEDVMFLDTLVQMSQCLVNAVDFSAFSNASILSKHLKKVKNVVK